MTFAAQLPLGDFLPPKLGCPRFVCLQAGGTYPKFGSGWWRCSWASLS